jgi:hypothetical protein
MLMDVTRTDVGYAAHTIDPDADRVAVCTMEYLVAMDDTDMTSGGGFLSCKATKSSRRRPPLPTLATGHEVMHGATSIPSAFPSVSVPQTTTDGQLKVAVQSTHTLIFPAQRITVHSLPSQDTVLLDPSVVRSSIAFAIFAVFFSSVHVTHRLSVDAPNSVISSAEIFTNFFALYVTSERDEVNIDQSPHPPRRALLSALSSW